MVAGSTVGVILAICMPVITSSAANRQAVASESPAPPSQPLQPQQEVRNPNKDRDREPTRPPTTTEPKPPPAKPPSPPSPPQEEALLKQQLTPREVKNLSKQAGDGQPANARLLAVARLRQAGVAFKIDESGTIEEGLTGMRVLRRLEHSEPVGGAFFSQDGTQIISCSGAGTVSFWDVVTGERNEQHKVPVDAGTSPSRVHLHGVFLGPDHWLLNRRVAVTAEKPLLTCFQVWTRAGDQLGPSFEVKQLLAWHARSPQEVLVLDQNLVLTNLLTRQELLTLEQPEAGKDSRSIIPGPRHAVFSGTGRRLLVSHGNEELRLYDVSSGKVISRCPAPGTVTGLAVSSAARLALSASRDEGVSFWDLERGERLLRFPRLGIPNDQGQGVALSPDRRYALCCSLEGDGPTAEEVVCLYDLAAGREVAAVKVPPGEHPIGVAFAPNGRYAISWGKSAVVTVWQLQ